MPLDEEASQVALQSEGSSVLDSLPHTLQQLVQVLLEEELVVGGSNRYSY